MSQLITDNKIHLYDKNQSKSKRMNIYEKNKEEKLSDSSFT